MDKLWQIKKDEHEVNHWTINENFDTSSCKTITIKSDYVEQSEVFILQDFNDDEKEELSSITKNITESLTILIEKKLDLFSSTVNNK